MFYISSEFPTRDGDTSSVSQRAETEEGSEEVFKVPPPDQGARLQGVLERGSRLGHAEARSRSQSQKARQGSVEGIRQSSQGHQSK